MSQTFGVYNRFDPMLDGYQGLDQFVNCQRFIVVGVMWSKGIAQDVVPNDNIGPVKWFSLQVILEVEVFRTVMV